MICNNSVSRGSFFMFSSVGQVDVEVTWLCNLSCSYCYHGEKNGRGGHMSEKTLMEAFEFVEKFGVKKDSFVEGKRVRATRISFFGGEPLLAFGSIRKFVTLAKEKGYDWSFIIVSNGTLGNEEMVNFCKEHKIAITRSIDGCPNALNLGRGKDKPDLLERFNKMTDLW